MVVIRACHSSERRFLKAVSSINHRRPRAGLVAHFFVDAECRYGVDVLRNRYEPLSFPRVGTGSATTQATLKYP